jgi:DNA-binding SARP family transcriptional activator/DNA-binding beta-propeller fold protein YncE/ABC-type branched-subunit amino acid transport system substrate-binding protein
MRFSLLGPLHVADGEREIPLGAPKQRALLALLLLRRGQPLSVEALCEGLWGGEPPATGAKAVRVYVAQLRKALGADLIVTQGGGYALPPDGHETDVARFEALTAEGRRVLHGGDPAAAATALREALALWRGPALADFRYDDFAQHDITRLEEGLLSALEARIDADLALGSEDELVPELQTLIREHPLRERLREQLMLALYRAGRQAEALEVYREGRLRLVEELGIEPSRRLQELERSILAHDESLGGARRRRLQPRARRRPGLLIGLGGVLLVAAAATALVVSLTRSGEAGISSVVPGNSLAAIDPRTGRVVAEIPVGTTPAAVAVGPGAVWVLNADDQTLSRVDSETNDVRTFAIGGTPTDLAAGTDGVWVGNGGRLARAQFAGTTAVTLTRIDAHTGGVLANVTLPRVGPSRSNAAENHIAFAAGAVWTIAPDFSLVRIDPARNEPLVVSRDVAAVAVAADRDEVWILDDEGKLFGIDPGTNLVTATASVPALGLSDLAVGLGSVWATDPYQGTLWRIDRAGRRLVQRTIDVGVGADSVAVGLDSIWVANGLQGTLTRVDPETNRVLRTIPLGNTPRAVAVGAGLVWVAVTGESAVAAARPQAGQTVQALPATICGPVVAGPEPPRFIVVSDLPLRGGPRFVTPQMSAAALHVLRRRSFRAGPYPVAFQSCDHSTARTGLYDETKCATNMKAYAANTDVIGVVGPFNSGCARAELPIAGPAGLAIVSPSASDVGLTRNVFYAPPDALQDLYPTGRRTFVRVASADDVQAAAAAVLATRLGAERILVLEDGGYGGLHAVYFADAAGRLGLQVESVRWNPHQLRLRRLAARARGSRPEAVFLCGLTDSGAGEVLRAVRAALAPSVPIIGCDALLPPALLFERAGPAARGIYVAVNGLVKERLGPAGKEFLRDFGATQPRAEVDIAAVYTAQATELLLDAIARSDGTRASVSAHLFEARVRDGLLGDFAIDADGEPVPSPVTILRIENAGGAEIVGGYEGARVDRVITPPARLLGKSR